jgi:hypothetical protein
MRFRAFLRGPGVHLADCTIGYGCQLVVILRRSQQILSESLRSAEPRFRSWYLDWATGATIVIMHTALFVLALVYSNLIRARLQRRSRAGAESPAPIQAPPV